MPLKTILSGQAARCTAKAKSTGTRCWRLANTNMGCRVCHVHGARLPSTIRRGKAHWAYKDGLATKQKREQDRLMAIELRLLEDVAFHLGLASGSRWVGRKPRAKNA
jgi:hypothetical protein